MEITSRKVILVEGKADREIVRRLLPEGAGADVIPFKNEGKLPKVVGAVVASARPSLEAVGIVVDANGSPEDAWKSAANALNRSGLASPEGVGIVSSSRPRTGVFVMPDSESSGSLETLLRRSVVGTPEAVCVDSYLKCLEAVRGAQRWSTKNRRDKAFAFAYAAAQVAPTDDLVVAARKSLWPLQSATFRPLAEFLRRLAWEYPSPGPS